MEQVWFSSDEHGEVAQQLLRQDSGGDVRLVDGVDQVT